MVMMEELVVVRFGFGVWFWVLPKRGAADGDVGRAVRVPEPLT